MTVRSDGERTWRLKNGVIDVAEVRDGGVVAATALRVVLTDRTDLVREVVTEAATVATLAEVRLVDPQLTKVVSALDANAVAEQYQRTAKYAGEMMGLSEAIGASYPAPTESAGFQPTTKFVLGVLAVFAFLYFLVSALNRQLGAE
jgi:hypothetical protein